MTVTPRSHGLILSTRAVLGYTTCKNCFLRDLELNLLIEVPGLEKTSSGLEFQFQTFQCPSLKLREFQRSGNGSPNVGAPHASASWQELSQCFSVHRNDQRNDQRNDLTYRTDQCNFFQSTLGLLRCRNGLWVEVWPEHWGMTMPQIRQLMDECKESDAMGLTISSGNPLLGYGNDAP